jgi:hypothetical protein
MVGITRSKVIQDIFLTLDPQRNPMKVAEPKA